MTSYSNIADLEFPFSDLFDRSCWQYKHDDHYKGLVKASVQTFARNISMKCANNSRAAATEAELSSLRFSMNYLLKNADFFTVAQILHCLTPNELIYGEIMMIVHKDKFNDVLEEASQQAAQSKHQSSINQDQLLQLQQIKTQHDQAMAQDKNQILIAQQELQVKSDHLFDFEKALREAEIMLKKQALDLQNQTENLRNQQHFQANNPNFGQVQSSIPRATNSHPFDPSESVKDPELKTILKQLNSNIKKSNHQGIKVNPPVYNAKIHLSLRTYGQRDFKMWAGTQVLSERNSTMFFYLAFRERRMHKNHVHDLSIDKFGEPTHETVDELITTIIQELKYSDEAAERLRAQFDAIIKLGAKVSNLEEEFQRIYEIRQLGWPFDSSDQNVLATKKKMIDATNYSNDVQKFVYQERREEKWINAVTFFQVTSYLRELEFRFNNTPVSLQPLNKPTNDPNAMQCNNCHRGQCEVHQVPREVKSVNNTGLAERTCRNKKCGNKFKPRRVTFVCCSADCNTTYKEDRDGSSTSTTTHSKPNFSRSSNFKKKQPRRGANNIQKNKEVNSSASDAELSKGKRFFMTPAHVYTKNCEIPTVVDNSLFDTGAGPTLVTLDLVKRLNLQNDIVEAPDPDLGGADASKMDGFVGSLKMNMQLEDTIGVLTNNFDIECMVYDKLNHDFIIGQDSMITGTNSFVMFPAIDVILFNATGRMFKKFSATNRNNVRSNNNIKKRVHSAEFKEKVDRLNNVPTPTPPKISPSFNVTKTKFDDEDSFYLTIPSSKLNKRNFKMFSSTVQNVTCNFMAKMENANEQEAALSNILTEGGLDGLIDNNSITATGTKLLETKKGQIKVGEQLSESMSKLLISYVNSFNGKVFDTSTLGKTVHECDPELKDNLRPETSPPKYMPLNEFMQSEASSLVSQMVDLGVLEKSTLPANSTIFIVQKSSGKWRLICDLRRYNDRLKDYVVHLPSPFELINKICKFSLFSYVDFPDAYFSMPMSDYSLKHNPVVASVSGMQYNFRYIRMPQGLKPATATFINMLNEIYAPIQDFVCNYLDDSVIGSEDNEEIHFKQLKRFVEITDKSGLKLSLLKSCFFTKNITFLNYTVSNNSWSISENQRNTINALNVDNLTQTKRESLAAFITHFSRFHTGVSYAARKIRDPNSTPKTVELILDNIKAKLIKASALRAANFKDELLIYTDASDLDCSGLVFQRNKAEGRYDLVTCFSRKFPAAMLKKNIYEKELWCLQQICKTYRYLFLGYHKKTFFNDNKAVVAAQNSRAPSLSCLFNYIKSTFSNVTFKHVPTNRNASDIFTRQAMVTRSVNAVTRASLRSSEKSTPPPVTSVPVVQSPTISVPIVQPPTVNVPVIQENSSTSIQPENVNEQQEIVASPVEESVEPIETSVSPPLEKLVAKKKLDDSLKNKLMKMHVNLNCAPSKRLFTTLQSLPKFSFLTVKDLDEVLGSCELCAQVQNFVKPRKLAPGITLARENGCNDVLFIDHKTMLTKARKAIINSKTHDPDYVPNDGKSSILTVLEPVSGLTAAFPVSSYDINEVKAALRLVFQLHGPVKTIVADNAPSFTALKSWLFDNFETQLCSTSAYHPSSNLSERPHLEFEKAMSIYDENTNKYNFEEWEDKLASRVMSSNSLKHQIYKMCPYEIHKNRFLKTIEPISFHEVGMEHRIMSEKRSKKVENLLESRLKTVGPSFKRGQVIKVAFPRQPIRFGVVTSYKDVAHKSSVLVSFKKAKAIGVNKNFICVPRFKAAPSNPPSGVPEETPVNLDAIVVPEDLTDPNEE